MGSRRRPLGRSYSGNGRFSAYSLSGAGSDGEDNGPLVESRPERRSYLLSVRPENRRSSEPSQVPRLLDSKEEVTVDYSRFLEIC
ncbi:UNVERIFIED_CONTAM: hypothetical protein K2H54_014348 [Gekko kuhli]